ncbi:MAG: glycosyltransferase family 4 protein [Gemmatimonadaceae bacterium]|nr:glycosyltransferase family 4 protein [Gemmatimonadaceae bacterium]
MALIDTVQVSGPGRQLVAVAAQLAVSGVVVLVVVFRRHGRGESPYEAFLRDNGVDFTVIEERGRFDVGVITRAKALLSAWRPTVIQTHGYKPGVVALGLKALGGRSPWIAFFHGSTTENWKVRAYHAIDQVVLRFADRVVVMSKAHQDAFGIGRGRVGVIYNAAIDAADSAPRRDRHATAGSVPRFSVIGRLSSEKGVDVLLQACHVLRQERQPFVLDVVGDGPERGMLEAMSVQLGLADVVTFCGHLSDVESVYARSDLIVIPSRSEGLPNVLLESIRRDVPVVATAVGAIPEVLTGSAAGVLCAPDDPRQLASSIVRALAPGFAAGGAADRRALAERFSVESRATHLRSLYRSVMGREHRGEFGPVVSSAN